MILKSIKSWWKNETLKFKLIIIATLLVSLLMSILSYWSISSIREEALITDNRFVEDISLLLASNVTPLIQEGKYDTLISVSQRFCSSTSSIRYIIYLDEEEEIYYSIPKISKKKIDFIRLINDFSSSRHYNSNWEYFIYTSKKDVNNIFRVTNVLVDLYINTNHIGCLILGLNPNPTVIDSSEVTIKISILVFFSIWIIIISGVVFNALSVYIAQPLNELLVGVKNISLGNFSQRINLPFGGELGELIYSFNEMAERLEKYDEQNLDRLTAEKAKLEILISRIADGAILLDINLFIILINSNALKALNLNLNETIIGKKFTDCFPLEISDQVLFVMKQIIKLHKQETLNYDHNNFCIESIRFNQKFIRIFLAPVCDYSTDSIRGIVMTIQDITKEVDLNEAKSKFIANVSHELRTPLFNILSFLETLYEYNDTLSNNQKLEFLYTANQETKRLSRLVNHILDLSRLESDRQYEFILFNIYILIDQINRLYKITLKEKNIICLIELEKEVTNLYGNYDLILQILINLITNSIKFTYSSGYLVIRFFYINQNFLFSHLSLNSKKIIRIEVTDTGIGINSSNRTKIFDRFFRLENYIHTLEGTGLGLSIVKNIVEKHNSQIFLSSELNNGTTFWFDLELSA
uniref:Uncharacterized sensor-like histidine kinase ycf26 n=1 Tax=Compsopogon caeruleus TaxID=31354 RepID=A0A1Z1XB02_9RHOD|nr:PAS domain-containing sensor histidine kinase [Compsopogon caeruleus]ARX96042.1 PAS domain-containing sensor histidine kinase [Compsopogon caeruleus]